MPPLNEWPATYRLRLWQEEVYAKYRLMNQQDFLIVATPGAGKTAAALRVAYWLLAQGLIDRIVVVVPSDHLKTQWVTKAKAICGLELDPAWENPAFADPARRMNIFEGSDYHGIVVTYHTVASNPEAQRVMCERRRTFVIFDEIHHAGDKKHWGGAVRKAFEPAARRLAISGTAFRSDNDAIPFIRYETDTEGVRKSKADFPYPYGRAISDGICRPVLFPSYDGTMEWLSTGGMKKHTFADDLPDALASQRLATALLPTGSGLRDMVKAADEQLVSIRAGEQADAGGLIVCVDQDKAKAIAKLLTEITGETPVLVISEDAQASAKLSAFEHGTSRWVVAVRMVSEGVDIPRLRVCVYATNIITELTFRQIVGRIVRVTPGREDEVAYFYFPADMNLIGFAECIAQERDHALSEELDDPKPRTPGDDPTPSLFVPKSSTSVPGAVIFEGLHIEQQEVARARGYATDAGVTIEGKHLVDLVRVLRVVVGDTPAGAAVPPSPANDAAAFNRKALRKRLTVNVNKLAGLVMDEMHLTIREAAPLARQILNSAIGVGSVDDANVEQLREQEKISDRWLVTAVAARARGEMTTWCQEWMAGGRGKAERDAVHSTAGE